MAALGMVERAWRVTGVIVRAHVQLAQEEANAEAERLARAVILACAALVLFGAAGLMGNALAAVLLVEQAGLSWTLTLGILLAFDVVVGAALAMSAKSTIGSRAFMEDTRKRAEETMQALSA